MKDEKVTRVKLYTFAEMKDAVADVVADIAIASSHDSDWDEPAQVALMEAAVGSKILAELSKRHERGEL